MNYIIYIYTYILYWSPDRKAKICLMHSPIYHGDERQIHWLRLHRDRHFLILLFDTPPYVGANQEVSRRGSRSMLRLSRYRIGGWMNIICEYVSCINSHIANPNAFILMHILFCDVQPVMYNVWAVWCDFSKAVGEVSSWNGNVNALVISKPLNDWRNIWSPCVKK